MNFTKEELKILVLALRLKYCVDGELVSETFKKLMQKVESELRVQIRYPEYEE